MNQPYIKRGSQSTQSVDSSNTHQALIFFASAFASPSLTQPPSLIDRPVMRLITLFITAPPALSFLRSPFAP
ncbi:hypothetical protein E2C01_003064 [Portunus trituberculatus]|uniref:Uncharacterized protein n=1 Tax=Portunus trituberculatus TaxID=210409 RepID=A0A5B7CLK7_PORTR|nr:hypothetical protein [Portunus trituberculatus]